jgi:hypothetical protein
MKSRQVLIGAGIISVVSAALALLATTAGAQSVCCNDVKFPERVYGDSGPSKYVVVDGIGRGEGVFKTIQGGIDHVTRDGTVMIKPPPEGVYELDAPLRISRPLTLANFGGMGIVRIHTAGRCASVDLRREGKVTINGLAFESNGDADGCIVVTQAQDFALNASDITVTRSALREADRCTPAVGGNRPASGPKCGFAGVIIRSGVATLQGNRIRRTGTAIALLNPVGEAHKVIGNYIAGNAIGVFADGGTKFLIEHNGIFRNHNVGVDLANATGTVADNDIEDNWTGLKILPPSAFSATAYAADGGPANDYADMNRATIRVERNLVTQYGIYRPDSYDMYHVWGADNDKLKDPGTSEREMARFGYALDFALSEDYIDDNVYDYPKRGSILSGVAIAQNCFFGPSHSWFDRDRFMPLIAKDKSSGYKDAATPLWFFDVNTWVEHLDYDGVDKIDHDNSIRSPRYDGFSGGMWTAIHNWFARNKKEMVCTFRFKEPVVGAPGNWPRFDTGPIR